MVKKNLKFELLDLEIEQLNNCSSDLGFFQRMVTRTMPLIRNIFPIQIQTWELALLKENKITKAIQELSEAFLALWNIAGKREDTRLKKQLIQLLQTVRGPKFEFGGPLIRIVYPRLQELYAFNVCIPKKYPFGTTAQKIIDYDYKWKDNYSKNSIQWLCFWRRGIN